MEFSQYQFFRRIFFWEGVIKLEFIINFVKVLLIIINLIILTLFTTIPIIIFKLFNYDYTHLFIIAIIIIIIILIKDLQNFVIIDLNFAIILKIFFKLTNSRVVNFIRNYCFNIDYFTNYFNYYHSFIKVFNCFDFIINYYSIK